MSKDSIIKVAFVPEVATNLDSVRGIGVHTTELMRRLQNLKIKNQKLKITPQGVADVVHYTKFTPFKICLPFIKPAKKLVLTIHDLIPLIYPKNYPPGVKGKINFLINKFLIKKNVDAIITISETSKKDICRFLGVSPEIVTVIYLAPATRKPAVSKLNLPSKFVLYAGDVNFNKNIPLLVKASKLAKVKLVIAGKQAKEIEKMDLDHPELAHLKSIDWSNTLRLGFVSDGELASIYKKALAYIQPSLYEGFGLPVLEAFASGCPVISARNQALVEVGGDACIYFDPNNFSDLTRKIRIMNNDLRIKNEYIKKGFERVKMFSWEKTARETYEVYKKVFI